MKKQQYCYAAPFQNLKKKNEKVQNTHLSDCPVHCSYITKLQIRIGVQPEQILDSFNSLSTPQTTNSGKQLT